MTILDRQTRCFLAITAVIQRSLVIADGRRDAYSAVLQRPNSFL